MVHGLREAHGSNQGLTKNVLCESLSRNPEPMRHILWGAHAYSPTYMVHILQEAGTCNITLMVQVP